MHPQAAAVTTKSELYEAATTGNLDRVNQLLAADNTLNIYETDDNDVMLLANVVANDHEPVASRLMDIWLSDYAFLRSLLRWESPKEESLVLVACGRQLCATIESYATPEMLTDPHQFSQGHLIVLLKHCGFRGEERKLLCIKPHASDLAFTTRATAKIVELVYTSRGGGLVRFEAYTRIDGTSEDGTRCNLMSTSILHMAGKRTMRNVFLRLQSTLLQEVPHGTNRHFWPQLCHLFVDADNTMDVNAIFQQMTAATYKSVGCEWPISCARDDWELLEAPLELNHSQLFDYVHQRMAADDTDLGWVLNNFLQNTKHTFYVPGRPSKVSFAKFLAKWSSHPDTDFLLPHRLHRGPGKVLVLQGLLADDSGSPAMLLPILTALGPRLGLIKGATAAVLMQLCETKQYVLLRHWMLSRRQIPEDCCDWDGSAAVYKVILDLVSTDRMEQITLAEFLVKQLGSFMTTELVGILLQRLPMYSGCQQVLAHLLQLEQCPPVVAHWHEQTGRTDRSPIFAALMMQHWDMYDMLLEAARGGELSIADAREYNDDSILAACIGSESIKQKHFKYARIPTPEAPPIQHPRVFAPSHWDEMHNGYEFRPAQKLTEPKDPDLRLDHQERPHPDHPVKSLNVIFNELVDFGCQVTAINGSGQSLLHLAAIFDNASAVIDLIDVYELDATLLDADGNLALHYASSSMVFETLMLASDRVNHQALAVRNRRGQTPLMAVCFASDNRRICSHFFKLAEQMLAECYRCDVLQPIYPIDKTTNDPLYVAQSGRMVRWLLRNGADVNATNSAGETCLHYFQRRRSAYSRYREQLARYETPDECIQQTNLDVLCAMLDDKRLDLLAVSNNGQSHLELIVSLTPAEYEYVEPQLDRLQPQLEKLFTMHCNWLTLRGEPLLFSAMRAGGNVYARRSMLIQRGQLQLDGLLVACSDSTEELEGAWQLLAGRLTREERKTAVTRDALDVALGLADKGAWPNVAAVQWLLERRPAMASLGGTGQHLQQVMDKLGLVNARKAVIAAAAALVAAGFEFGGAEKWMMCTVLRSVLSVMDA